MEMNVQSLDPWSQFKILKGLLLSLVNKDTFMYEIYFLKFLFVVFSNVADFLVWNQILDHTEDFLKMVPSATWALRDRYIVVIE